MQVELIDARGLNEIYTNRQSLQYTWLDSKYKPLHMKVKCKDYLADFVWSEKNNKEGESCGFKHKPTGYNFNKKWHHMALTFSGENLKENKERLASFLAALEKQVGIKQPSKVRLSADEKVIVVSFGNEWIASAPVLGFFTLSLRLGMTYDGRDVTKYFEDPPRSKYGTNDRSTCTYNGKYIEPYLKGNFPTKLKWTDMPTMSVAHSNGPISYGYANAPNNKEPW